MNGKGKMMNKEETLKTAIRLVLIDVFIDGHNLHFKKGRKEYISTKVDKIMKAIKISFKKEKRG